MVGIAKHIRVLAIQGVNDSQDTGSGGYIAQEIQVLNEEFANIRKTTKFHGINLLDVTAIIGPFVVITNSTIGTNTLIHGFSTITDSIIGDNVVVADFATITNSNISAGTRVLDFTTITNDIIINGGIVGEAANAMPTTSRTVDLKFQTGAYSDDTQTASIGDASMSQLHSEGGGNGAINTSLATQTDFEDLVEDMDYVLKGIDSKRAILDSVHNKLESSAYKVKYENSNS